jgi:hypothetical protein
MSSLFEVLQDVRADPSLQYYVPLSERFFDYLVSVPYQTVETHSQYTDGYIEDNKFPVIYRWSETYRKSIIAKFSRLDEWYIDNRSDVSLISFTGSSRGLTVDKHWEILNQGKVKLMKSLRYVLKRPFNYVTTVEPHPGYGRNRGYAHSHMALFHGLTDEDQEKLKKKWASYGFGSYKHGLQIRVTESQDEIKDLKNYLLKYISKSWIETGGKYSKAHWDKHLFIFNAVAWENQYRFWGASRKLSDVMKYREDIREPECHEDLIYSNPHTCFRVGFQDANLCQEGTNLWMADEDKIEEVKAKHIGWAKQCFDLDVTDSIDFRITGKQKYEY